MHDSFCIKVLSFGSFFCQRYDVFQLLRNHLLRKHYSKELWFLASVVV
ncbi:hypothetical protein Mpsy_0174 [Methanolobus psychrophilus R15]|nr:hypothetical protein Mpsy_0174 [Methanolobus psychrophilus R15]